MILRPYQTEQKAQIKSLFQQGVKKVLLCSPTGSGKTVTFVDIMIDSVRKGRTSMIVVNRKELLDQAYEKCVAYGLLPTKIIPSYKGERNNCYIASIDTLRNRAKPPVDLVIIDECHFGRFVQVHAWYPDAYIIGATATPISSRRHVLSDYYHAMVDVVGIPELIEQGFLLPCTTIGVQMDLSEIKIKAGDFDEREMFDAFNKTKLYDGVIENYHKFSAGQKALVFNCNIKHSRVMADIFKANGIESYSVDSKTPKEERGELLQAFRDGEFGVLNNCSILTTGYDDPSIGNIIINRATLLESLFLQMCGRGSRPFNYLDIFNVIDQGANWARFGCWDYPRTFTLELKKNKRSDKLGVAPCKDCPQCQRILFNSVKVCDGCGHEFKVQEKVLEIGKFEVIKKGKWNGMDLMDMNRGQMKAYARANKHDEGWINDKVNEKRRYDIDALNRAAKF